MESDGKVKTTDQLKVAGKIYLYDRFWKKVKKHLFKALRK